MSNKKFDILIGKLIQRVRTNEIYLVYGIREIDNNKEYTMQKIDEDMSELHIMSCPVMYRAIKYNDGWRVLSDS